MAARSKEWQNHLSNCRIMYEMVELSNGYKKSTNGTIIVGISKSFVVY